MTIRYYSSVAPETTLAAGINNAATTIQVGSTTGFPALTPYTLALDYEGITEELVQVNNAAGVTLDVTRAVDGTSAASHNAGARVRHVSSARDFADSRTHENSDQGVHGLSPTEEIVGTESVQTLTNKTLDSPVITGTVTGSPGFTGTWTGSAAATAKLRLQNATDVSPTSTDHAFQIGVDSSTNLRMDGNELQVANNGVAAPLGLNSDGGTLSAFINQAADSIATNFNVNGVVDANQVVVSRVNAATAIALNFKQDSDTTFRYTQRPNGDMNFGAGGVAAQDVALGRSGAGTLLVSPNLIVGNAIVAANSTIPINNGPLTVTGTLKAPNIRAGNVLAPAPPGGAGNTSVNVTFTPAMGSIPNVTATPKTTVNPTDTTIVTYVDNVTTTGFTIRALRSDNSTTRFMWIAVEDSP